jgi:hypothetical protein
VKIESPFTDAQCISFNEFQDSGVFHPFTCGYNSQHQLLKADNEYVYCLDCEYTQDWAHDWMLNGKWQEGLVTCLKPSSE